MSDLILKQVSKAFKDGDQDLVVLDAINFTAKPKELVGIIGPSGSGKSTLLSIMGALMRPDSGQVVINDQEISQLDDKDMSKLRAHEIGFVFQDSQLLSYLTVIDQLKVVSVDSDNERKDQRAHNLLEALDLADKAKAYPHELSGGQRQRVAVARAFINQPTIILADEPTAHLDDDRGKQVVEMLRQGIYKENKIGIIVTHDTRLLGLMDRTYRLEHGHLTEINPK